MESKMRMRYLAPFVLSAFFLASCGGSDSSSEKKDTSASSNNEAPADNSMVKEGAAEAAASKGAELISKSDCLTCHKVDMKVVGPSYKEVAAKYEATGANIEMLAMKIISGGSGHWGEVPMQAHPNVSKEDATEMVKYILSLK